MLPRVFFFLFHSVMVL
uniref:Uncharacterized protein n=1 Tax=Rhizophora mucronata TaxID=61149 RepID=A0A2P2PUH6_RHIMU